jgi:hypothetical protein
MELMIASLKSRELKEQRRRKQVAEILLEAARRDDNADMANLLEQVLADVESVVTDSGATH